MAGELGAVIESDRPAPLGRERGQELGDGAGHRRCSLAGQGLGQEQPRVAFHQGEQGLTPVAEEHQVGFPMTGSLAVSGGLGPLGQGLAQRDEGGGTAALATPPAPLGLAPGQVVAPVVVLPAAQLAVDEAVDGLVGDDDPARLQRQTASDLLGRPTPLESGEDPVAQRGVALQLGTAPAAGAGLLLSIDRLVALSLGAITAQLSRNRRWRAIQTCCDLAH